MYAIYDMKDKELCVGVFDYRQEAASYLGIHKDSLNRNIQKQTLVKNQYKVMKIEEETKW